jgi:hypothetical protein
MGFLDLFRKKSLDELVAGGDVSGVADRLIGSIGNWSQLHRMLDEINASGPRAAAVVPALLALLGRLRSQPDHVVDSEHRAYLGLAPVQAAALSVLGGLLIEEELSCRHVAGKVAVALMTSGDAGLEKLVELFGTRELAFEAVGAVNLFGDGFRQGTVSKDLANRVEHALCSVLSSSAEPGLVRQAIFSLGAVRHDTRTRAQALDACLGDSDAVVRAAAARVRAA